MMFAGMRRLKGFFAVAALGLAVSFVAVDMAEARRAGGGFGSRGTRTFQAPPATRTAPQPAAPVDRTMTPGTAQSPTRTQPAAAPNTPAQPSRGLFGGMAGGLMGGLLMGGLFGMMMGGGFGGAAGFLGMLLQVAVIGGLVMLAMRFFANRRQQQQPAYAGSGNNSSRSGFGGDNAGEGQQGGSSFKIPKIGSLAGAGAAAAAPVQQHTEVESKGDELGIGEDDLNTFERMLRELQAAYAAEDYAALRRLSTPEAMSYLAEELSDNATSGVKNDVRDVRLLQGDVAESWHEEGRDYATVAMLYSAIDVMRDRTNGKLISGDEHKEVETTELWTFVRSKGGEWQVSAIQSSHMA